jgi:hypothetical protein
LLVADSSGSGGAVERFSAYNDVMNASSAV